MELSLKDLFKNMDVLVLPVFKYDETLANLDLCTNFVAYARKTYGIVLGCMRDDPYRFVCPNWWFNRFVTSRSGRPMRLTPSYITKEYGGGFNVPDFAMKRALEQLSSYPGINDRTHYKLDNGILLKGFEGVEAKYLALSPSDIDGIRTNYIPVDMMPKSLEIAYKVVLSKSNWQVVEEYHNAVMEKYPGFTFFKSGMNVVEQVLAHLDSAGYYIASVLDSNRDRIKGANNVNQNYVSSLDFREEFEKVYGDKVSHYFENILKNKDHACSIKMYYQF